MWIDLHLNLWIEDDREWYLVNIDFQVKSIDSEKIIPDILFKQTLFNVF